MVMRTHLFLFAEHGSPLYQESLEVGCEVSSSRAVPLCRGWPKRLQFSGARRKHRSARVGIILDVACVFEFVACVLVACFPLYLHTPSPHLVCDSIHTYNAYFVLCMQLAWKSKAAIPIPVV